jgi:hypothetical protein
MRFVFAYLASLRWGHRLFNSILAATCGKAFYLTESGIESQPMKPRRIMAAALMALAIISQGKATPKQNSTRGGTLVVSQSGRGPILNEGGITFFQVYSKERVVEEKMLGGKLVKKFGQTTPQSTGDGDSATFSLPAGSYELRGFVRVCDGNCNSLGAPQYECRALFNMQESDSLSAVRQQEFNGTCSIKLTSKRK